MKNVCFTGHRYIKDNQMLKLNLENILQKLIIEENASDFYAGGAIGWDTLCAMMILHLRNDYPHIRLHMILPCNEAEQMASWKEGDKKIYRKIISSADYVEFAHNNINILKTY